MVAVSTCNAARNSFRTAIPSFLRPITSRPPLVHQQTSTSRLAGHTSNLTQNDSSRTQQPDYFGYAPGTLGQCRSVSWADQQLAKAVSRSRPTAPHSAVAKPDEKPDPLEIQLVDFDGVTYRLSTPDANNRNIVRLSMAMKCYALDLVKYGAPELLRREYGSMLLATPETGFDVSLQFDLGQVVAAGTEARGRWSCHSASVFCGLCNWTSLHTCHS